MPEELLHVMVGPVLVFPGEIEIDIRNLVPLEAQEHLEGNVKAVLYQLSAAVGAVPVRQVHPHVEPVFVHVEKALPAVGAPVMGRQGVHLGDAAHPGHKAGAHGTPGAHQIAVLQGSRNQLLGDVVERAVPVADDGFQLLLQPGLHDLRQRGAVHLLRRVPGHLLNIVLGIIPEGLEGILPLGMHGEKRHGFHHVRDLPGIVDHNLPAFFLSQIAEFLQHLLRGFEIERGLLIRVLVIHPGLDHRPADGVLRVQKMHVPRGHHGLAQLFSQADDDPVQLPQVLFVLDIPFPQQEGVVPDGLNLQIIIEGGDLLQLLLALPGQHRPEQLPRLAGAAQDQALPVTADLLARHMRLPAEVLQMGEGHQPVQVHQPLPAFRQQDDMPAAADGSAPQIPVQILIGMNFRMRFRRGLEHAVQALGRGRGVVNRPVRVLQADAQMLAQRSQPEAFQRRIQLSRVGQRIHHRIVIASPQPSQLRAQQRRVKGAVVGRDGAVPDKVHEFRQHFRRPGLSAEHHVRDAGNLRDFRRQRFPRIHQLLEGIHDGALFQLHRADFDDPGRARVEPGAFKVQHYDRPVKGLIRRALDDVPLVDQISLAAGNQLDFSLGRPEGRRKALQHPVVRHGDGWMAPFDRPADQVSHRRQRVHGAHIGVHMQLNPLFLRLIEPLLLLHLHQIPDHDGDFPAEGVILAFSADFHVHAFPDPGDFFLHGLALRVGNGRQIRLLAPGHPPGSVPQKGFAENGAGIVRHREGQQHHLSAGDLFSFQHKHVALDHHQAALAVQFLDLHRPVRDGSAEDGLPDRRIRHFGNRNAARPQGLRRRFPGGLRRGPGGLFLRFRRLPGRSGFLLFRGRSARAVPGGHFPSRHDEGTFRPLPAHLGQPGFPVAGYGGLYDHLGAKDLPDGGFQPPGHIMLRRILQGKLIRKSQGNSLPLVLPSDAGQPGGHGRIVSSQEIGQHIPVGADLREKMILQRRARHPHRQFPSRKRLPQDSFQPQEFPFPYQRRAFEGKVGLLP